MRNVNVLTLALVALLATTALANCPDLTGIWSSIDNPEHNEMLVGRYAEGWCNGNPGEAGNIQNAMSWNGSTLMTEWHIWDMTINAAGPYVVYDGVTGGNGIQIIQTQYDGGQFWLSGSNIWTDDAEDLFGDIQDYLVVTTVTYQDGEVVAAVSNITFGGVFGDCPESLGCIIEFAIANAALVWRSDFNWAMPSGYPPFLCGDGGELHGVSDITLGIACDVVATEAHSWSDIKSLYQ